MPSSIVSNVSTAIETLSKCVCVPVATDTDAEAHEKEDETFAFKNMVS